MIADYKFLDKIKDCVVILNKADKNIVFLNNKVKILFSSEIELKKLTNNLFDNIDKNDTVLKFKNRFYHVTFTHNFNEDSNLVIIVGSILNSYGEISKGNILDDNIEESSNLYNEIMVIRDGVMNHVFNEKSDSSPADLDSLTGLPNKHRFIEISNQIITADNIKDEFVIVYFNLDRFQTFNDRYGFKEGDKFLKAVVKELLCEFEYYLCGRYSDDHFVILTTAHGVVEKIINVHNSVHKFEREVTMELNAGIYKLDNSTPVSKACDRAKLACDSIKYNYSRDYIYYQG